MISLKGHPLEAATAQKPRKRESPEVRRRQILEISRELVAESGFEAFSLRKVANTAGIHLKTLQYYFSTRQSLIHATLEDTYTLYRSAVEEIIHRESASEDQFRAYIRYLLSDQKDRQTAGFFYQLWARAHTDPDTNTMMEKMYANHTRTLESLIRPLVPESQTDQCRTRAIMVAALIEGMMLFIGHGKNESRHIANIEDDVVAQCTRIATQPVATDNDH